MTNAYEILPAPFFPHRHFNSADIECQQDEACETSPLPPNPSLLLNSRDDDLTLSQISPRKIKQPEPEVIHTARASRSPTPARTATKRPLSAVSSSTSRKKGRAIVTSSVRRSPKSSGVVLQPSIRKNVVSKLPHSPHHRRTRLGPHISQAHVVGKDNKRRQQAPIASGSRHRNVLIECKNQRTAKYIKLGNSSTHRDPDQPVSYSITS